MTEDGRAGLPPASAPSSRSRCRLELSPNFERMARRLSSLGATPALRQAEATANARAFFNQWKLRSSVSDRDLGQGRWKLKALQGSHSRAVKLHQIRVGSGRLGNRAVLLIEEGPTSCRMIFLSVFHKDEQQRAIEHAVEIAEREGGGH